MRFLPICCAPPDTIQSFCGAGWGPGNAAPLSNGSVRTPGRCSWWRRVPTCPVLDTLFLAAPIAFTGRLVQHVGRVLRGAAGKHVVEVHDLHDIETGVLAM